MNETRHERNTHLDATSTEEATEEAQDWPDVSRDAYLGFFDQTPGLAPLDWRRIERVVASTPPEPCAYLPERMEKKLILPMITGDVQEASDFNRAGYRRSHEYFYRPVCFNCNRCKPLRLPVDEVRLNRSAKRLLTRHEGLSPQILSNEAEQDHWELFSSYVRTRHTDGGMATMGRKDFAHMVEHAGSNTALVEWRCPTTSELKAAALIDLMDDGISAVYSYFDTQAPQDAFGRFIILSLIEVCRQAKLPYLYLGFWVEGAKTMDYKADFKPHEVFTDSQWHRVEAPG